MPADTVEVVVKLSGLAAVQAGMRRLRDSISGPLESAAQRARGFDLSLGTSLLAGFSGYRVAAELKRALDGMGRAAATSQRLGVVTDELTGLEYAATLAESSAQDLHTSLKFLAKAAAAWEAGGGTS